MLVSLLYVCVRTPNDPIWIQLVSTTTTHKLAH